VIIVNRSTVRLLISDPSMTPHQLGRLSTTALTATTGRVLTAFFAVSRTGFDGGDQATRSKER